MTVQTNVYFYNQRQQVVIFDSSVSNRLRYEKVYSKNLTIIKGVDNLLEFSFLNQEQKPVDLTNKEITCRIIDYTKNTILIEKSLINLVPLNGIMALQITKDETEHINSQKCFYSLEIPVNNFNYPVYVDSKFGARGVILIEDAVLPVHVESTNILIPDHNKPSINNPVIYNTSVFDSEQKSLTTLQLNFQQFTGSFKVLGSISSDFSTSYLIYQSTDLVDFSDNQYVNVQGYHAFIRIQITNIGTLPANQTGQLSGDLIQVLVR